MITIVTKTVNPDGSVTLTGTGGPVANWVVKKADGTTVSSGTGEAGAIGDAFTHVIPALPSGTYTITISGPGNSSQDVVVTIPVVLNTNPGPGPTPLSPPGSGVGSGAGVGIGSGVGSGAAALT